MRRLYEESLPNLCVVVVILRFSSLPLIRFPTARDPTPSIPSHEPHPLGFPLPEGSACRFVILPVLIDAS